VKGPVKVGSGKTQKSGEHWPDKYVDSVFYFDFAHQQTRGTLDLDGIAITPQFKWAERVHKLK